MKVVKCTKCGKVLCEANGEVKKICPKCKKVTHIVITSLGVINLIDNLEILNNIPIASMDFTIRTCMSLQYAGIKLLGDLTECTENKIRKVANLGERGYQEIVEKLCEYGLTLKQ